MPAVTYKCPNCDSYLEYSPENDHFSCAYCGSTFTLDALKVPAQPKAAEAPKPEAQLSVYTCKSCGAEIVTDDTTAATFCVYCHNPVILSGALSGELLPDQVIPFRIPKETVVAQLKEWCKKKRFIDKAFLSDAQVEKLSGVYFPFFVVDGAAKGSLNKRGTKISTWKSGNYTYTKTDTYAIERAGTVNFNDITITALKKKHTFILNGILPFNQKDAVPFTTAYLSGFLADKRNITKEQALPEVEKTVGDFTKKLLDDTITGYSGSSFQSDEIRLTQTDFSYVLAPVWMLCFQFAKDNYYFALNGLSGKIAGRVPYSPSKLWALAAALFGLVFAAMLAIGWWL